MDEENAPLTEEEVEARLAAADGVLGAAGHRVTDPVMREIVRRKIRGEISDEEADRLILLHNGIDPERVSKHRKGRRQAVLLAALLVAGSMLSLFWISLGMR